MNFKILNGNNIDVLKQYPDNHFDSIVTDPPYGIDFLGKHWDANTGALETYQECLRVLKPGGHILAFSAARTYHHLAYTLEVAGFEIRDQIMWIYSSGFPKSQDVGKSIQRSLGVKETIKPTGPKSKTPRKNPYSNILSESQDKTRTKEDDYEIEVLKVTDPQAKEWAGWGTALKPAHEPICMARKPLKEKNIALNCQKYGTGAINVDATRVEGLTEKEINWTPQRQQAGDNTEIGTFGAAGLIGQEISMYNEAGRFPSNVIGEIPDYQKYFYCPKVSRTERHIGFDTSKIATNPAGMYDSDGTGQQYNPQKKSGDQGNNHPTVKPIELMKYLIKLVTRPGGKVLDPFNGSGSTGCAAVELGYDYTGIELDPKYVEIANKRIEAWYQHTHNNTFDELFTEETNK